MQLTVYNLSLINKVKCNSSCYTGVMVDYKRGVSSLQTVCMATTDSPSAKRVKREPSPDEYEGNLEDDLAMLQV